MAQLLYLHASGSRYTMTVRYNFLDIPYHSPLQKDTDGDIHFYITLSAYVISNNIVHFYRQV